MSQHTRPGTRAREKRREEAEARNAHTLADRTRIHREGPPDKRGKT